MKLPVVSGDDVIRSLKKAGFEVVRQRGSHVSLHKRTPEGILLTVVPRKHSCPSKAGNEKGHTLEHTQAGRNEQGRIFEIAMR